MHVNVGGGLINWMRIPFCHRAQVFENLSRTLFAPSVQMQGKSSIVDCGEKGSIWTNCIRLIWFDLM
jgi:hypothetical protein